MECCSAFPLLDVTFHFLFNSYLVYFSNGKRFGTRSIASKQQQQQQIVSVPRTMIFIYTILFLFFFCYTTTLVVVFRCSSLRFIFDTTFRPSAAFWGFLCSLLVSHYTSNIVRRPYIPYSSSCNSRTSFKRIRSSTGTKKYPKRHNLQSNCA